MNWLTKLDVRTVIIENVPEFVDWGPLDPKTLKPIKKRKGEHFQAWFLNFHNLGYQAEWRMLNSADCGDATSRVRFFLPARRDASSFSGPNPPTPSTTPAGSPAGSPGGALGKSSAGLWRAAPS